jgi:SAM-dependent methyltransferase
MDLPLFEDITFPSNARILEIGCGGGHYAAWAAERVAFVLAVDNDPRMLQWAEQQFPPAKHPNLRFQQADARELDFVTDPFDFVTTNACLHYLNHPGEAFQAIARHLRPGGRLCLSCLGFGNLKTFYKAIERVMRAEAWAACFENFRQTGSLVDIASCDPWLQTSGLTKRRARLTNEPFAFPDRHALQHWFNSNFGNYFEVIPEARRPRFSDEVIDGYLRGLNKKEPVRVFRVWLQLEAVK